MNCVRCHNEFVENDRVIYNTRETFVFKPADVPDTVNPAKVTPAELAESRKEHLRTAVASVFVDWGKAQVPDGAFNFRHQWCEPIRTGSGAGNAHAVNKHAIRFGRAMPGRLHGKPA